MVRATALLLPGLLVLAACSGGSSPAAPEPDVLGTWELVSGSAGGAALPQPAGGQATLRFEDAQLGGISFCNHYSGGYRLEGGVLTVDSLGGTEMGCAPEVMAAETAYLTALAAADRAGREGDELVLTGADVALRFARQQPVPDHELVGTHWVLDTLIDGDVASSVTAEPILHLAPDGTAIGSTGCRGLAATWQPAGDPLAFTSLTSEDGACPPELTRQDELVLDVLGSGPQLAITGDRMTLTGADGRALVYRAAPPR